MRLVRTVRSDVAVLGGGYGVELGGEGLEVGILSEVALRLSEESLSLGLQRDLGGTERVLLGHEVVLVDGFCIERQVPYCLLKSGLSSFFSTILTFLAKYSGLGLAKVSE